MREQGCDAQSLLETLLAEVQITTSSLPVALMLKNSEIVKTMVLEAVIRTSATPGSRSERAAQI